MLKTVNHILSICLIATFTLTSCDQSLIDSSASDDSIHAEKFNQNGLNADQEERELDFNSIESLQDINRELENRGLNVRIAYAETVTSDDVETHEAGQTIHAHDREKQLNAQWVPGDTRRDADGNNLTYLIDQTSSFANLPPRTLDGEPAMDSAFDTWNSIKKNAKLNIVKVPDPGIEPSFFFGGDTFLADISVIGFLPGVFFDIILGFGASESVLGVTFTFIFIDADGNPTDINNDGFEDVAFKEIWYNNYFQWKTDPNALGFDIETVALHENGHGLGFGHFGKISVTNNNNKLHVSPRAVMNAFILGTQRDLLGTDKASYNSVYGNWPR